MAITFDSEGPTAHICAWSALVRVENRSDVFRRAILHILDTVAVAVAGRHAPQVQKLAQFHDASIAVDGASLAFGADRTFEASTAALLNGAAAHALDYDDQSYSVYGHTSAVVLPAAIAVAQENHNTGRDLVLAFLIGTEVAGKIGRALNPSHFHRGWHSTGTLGVLGATVACARLLGLDAETTSHAVGLAAVRAGGLRANNPTMAKAFQAGQAAQAGVLSAKMARAGVTASQSVLESPVGLAAVYNHGESVDFSVCDLLADPWEILDPGLMIKRYPACSSMATVLDGTRQLMMSGLEIDDIQSIRCSVTPLVSESMSRELPTTGYAGKFSLPFCLASFLIHGKLDLDSFRDEQLKDAQFRRLADRIVVEVDSTGGWAPDDGPEAASISVELVGGHRLSVRQELPDWGYSATLSEPELMEKVRYCLDRTLSGADATELTIALLALDEHTSLDFLMRPNWWPHPQSSQHSASELGR